MNIKWIMKLWTHTEDVGNVVSCLIPWKNTRGIQTISIMIHPASVKCKGDKIHAFFAKLGNILLVEKIGERNDVKLRERSCIMSFGMEHPQKMQQKRCKRVKRHKQYTHCVLYIGYIIKDEHRQLLVSWSHIFVIFLRILNTADHRVNDMREVFLSL